jgi:hypothetical protein
MLTQQVQEPTAFTIYGAGFRQSSARDKIAFHQCAKSINDRRPSATLIAGDKIIPNIDKMFNSRIDCLRPIETLPSRGE